MKKILLTAILSFTAFSASSQIFPPSLEQGYQAVLRNGNTIIIVQENSMAACQDSVNSALNNNYTLEYACRYDIFFI